MKSNEVKNMEELTSGADREIKKHKAKAVRFLKSWKLKLLTVLVGIGLAILTVWSVFYSIYSWSEGHKIVIKPLMILKIQIPFKDYPPVIDRILSPVVEAKQVSEAELLATKKAQELAKREAMVERIYQTTRYLETRIGFDTDHSDATHLYCQSIGQVNEIGYFPEGNRKFCFKDEADQHNTFNIWFSKRLDKGMTFSQITCLYNTGEVQPQCRRSLEIGLSD